MLSSESQIDICVTLGCGFLSSIPVDNNWQVNRRPRPPAFLSAFLSAHPAVCLPACLPACPPARLPACLPACPPARLPWPVPAAVYSDDFEPCNPTTGRRSYRFIRRAQPTKTRRESNKTQTEEIAGEKKKPAKQNKTAGR